MRTPLYGVLFFSPTHFAPDGRIGENNTPHTKQHICKLANRAKTQVCKRAIFFALAPVHNNSIFAILKI